MKGWLIAAWVVLLLLLISTVFYRARVHEWQTKISDVLNQLVDEHKTLCELVVSLHPGTSHNCPGDGAGKSPPPPDPYP